MKVDLKYKVIRNKKQYMEYCDILEGLIFSEKKSVMVKDEISLLSLLIYTWDEEHNTFNEIEPVELIKFLMVENDLKSQDMIGIMGVSKSMVSQILNKRKGLSKDVIRNLANYFKMSQESFNKQYQLVSEVNRSHPYSNLMNTRKDLVPVVMRSRARYETTSQRNSRTGSVSKKAGKGPITKGSTAKNPTRTKGRSERARIKK